MPEMQLDKMDLGIHDFFTYPPVGEDDYAYMFQTAQVRSMETQMLTRTALLDMANASDFTSAAGSLSGTEYTLPSGAGAAELETMLRQRRSAVRRLFEDLMLDPMYHLPSLPKRGTFMVTPEVVRGEKPLLESFVENRAVSKGRRNGAKKDDAA